MPKQYFWKHQRMIWRHVDGAYEVKIPDVSYTGIKASYLEAPDTEQWNT